MSITIQLDLPESVAAEAKAKGLLESEVLSELLERELKRRQACEDFGAMLEKLHSINDEPMSMEEIQAEVDAVREERRRREGGR